MAKKQVRTVRLSDGDPNVIPRLKISETISTCSDSICSFKEDDHQEKGINYDEHDAEDKTQDDEDETLSDEDETQDDDDETQAQPPSPPTNKVTVKFLTANEEGKPYAQSHVEDTMIGDLRYILIEDMVEPSNDFQLLFNGEPLEDDMLLKDLEPETFGVIEMQFVSTQPIKFRYASGFMVPDVITVRIQTSSDGMKEVAVEIENRTIIKPFLGGYFDKYSGIEYHHGYSQTGPPPPKVPPWMKSHRETQTYFLRNRKIEQGYAQATQMSNKDIYIPSITDKILISGPYEMADDREKRLDVEGKVRTIQRYFRAWKMRKALKVLSLEYHKRLQRKAERDAAEEQDDQDRRKRALIRKIFPRSAADFAMLYAMTERWKKAEIKRIVTMHCGPARIAEFYMLLEREIEILRSIEALRHKMRNDRRLEKELEFFKIIGDPYEFITSYKGIPVQIDTLWTRKGREYHEMYKKICDRSLDRKARIEVLEEVRRKLADHSNCELSTELIGLVERALELMARGFTGLETLNRRIEALMMQHYKMSDCNEGVTDRFLRQTEQRLRGNLLYCPSCRKMKPIEQFHMNMRKEKVKFCAACKYIDKSEEPWIDISPYRFILKQIRKYERLHSAVSSVSFIMQDKDIYFLVTNIWHGHSALSECDDVYELRLVRWQKDKDWSPWNCILLTKEEARAHLQVHRLEDVYDDNFRSKVFAKQASAMKQFHQVLKLDKCVSEMERPVAKKYSSAHCLHDSTIELDKKREAEEKAAEEKETMTMTDLGSSEVYTTSFEYPSTEGEGD